MFPIPSHVLISIQRKIRALCIFAVLISVITKRTRASLAHGLLALITSAELEQCIIRNARNTVLRISPTRHQRCVPAMPGM